MANNFSGDSSCKALWRFESGALTTDSRGNGNTLVADGTPAESLDAMEGTGSVSLVRTDSDGYHITDANLSSGFPLKNGDTTKKITVCAWVKFTSLPGGHSDIASKADVGGGYETFRLCAYVWGSGPANYNFDVVLGCTETVYQSWHAFDDIGDISGSWHHLGFTYDDSTRVWQLRWWNGSTAATASDTATYNISLFAVSDFCVGRVYSGESSYLDGLLDEVVVFNRVLSIAEIDSVRNGTFASEGSLVVSLGDRMGQYVPVVQSGHSP